MMNYKKARSREAGTTYIELIIVCAIIGIIMTSAVLLIRGNIQSMKINSTVGLIKNQIRMVRADAIHRAINQTIRFDQSGNKLIINGTVKIPLSKEVMLANINVNNSTLTFTSRGNCQGNRLETLDLLTTGNENVGYRIRIIGATGTPDSFPLHR
jgi:Tfp pilus assembly protein FimT